MNPSRYSSPLILSLSMFLLLTIFATLIRAEEYQGCYAFDNSLSVKNTSIFQSTGLCNLQICGPEGYAVYGLSDNQCYCGNSIPSDQVDGSKCNLKCPGWQNDTCGAVGYLSVWLTGTGNLVGNAATQILSVDPTATKTSAVASSTVYVTSPGQTTIIQSATAQSQTPSSGGGVSGGEAAGIAIGVLALIGIGAAAFFFIRRRRRDDYQKQYEGSGFGSSPGSLNRPFGTDQRLEPQMLKRESVGSLADEHDYSRKILRVINPDGS